MFKYKDPKFHIDFQYTIPLTFSTTFLSPLYTIFVLASHCSFENTHDNSQQCSSPEDPTDDSERKSGVNSVAGPDMTVPAPCGSRTLLMSPDVDRQCNPGSEEHSPIGELEKKE